MPLTIAICDDNENQIKDIRHMLNEWVEEKPFSLAIDEYSSAEGFLFKNLDKPCDLLMLDIEMGKISGMELAKRLRTDGNMLPIIFITGYSDYMSDGYEVEALHYLLKPVDKQKLFAVLDRYIKRHSFTNNIAVKCEGKTIHILTDTIMYCEAMGKKTHIHTKEQMFICETGIGNFVSSLGSEFVLCHRSYIVNLRYTRSIGKAEITLDNGVNIPISRRLYKDINEKFIHFYTKG